MVAATIIERYRDTSLTEEIAVVSATNAMTYVSELSKPEIVIGTFNEDVATTATVSFAISGRTITIHHDGEGGTGGIKKNVALLITGYR